MGEQQNLDVIRASNTRFGFYLHGMLMSRACNPSHSRAKHPAWLCCFFVMRWPPIPLLLAAIGAFCIHGPAWAQSASDVGRLIGQLSGDDPTEQMAAATILVEKIPDAAVDPLAAWIDAGLPKLFVERSFAVEALVEQHSNHPTVLSLLELLAQNTEEESIRAAGVTYLDRLGAQSADVAHRLFQGFGADAQYIDIEMALRAIPRLAGEPFIDQAGQALQSGDTCEGAVRLLRAWASNQAQKRLVVETFGMDLSSHACADFIYFLGDLGREARSLVPQLAALIGAATDRGVGAGDLVDDRPRQRAIAAADAVANIGIDIYEGAEEFSRAELTSHIEALENALAGIVRAGEAVRTYNLGLGDAFGLQQRTLRIAIKGLADNRARRIVEPLREGLFDAARRYPVVAAAIGYIALMLLVRVVLLRIWPLGLLRLNEWVMRASNFQEIKQAGAWATPLTAMVVLTRWLSVIGLLRHAPRSLDAWVSARTEQARRRLEQLPTVRQRGVYVPLPLIIDGKLVSEPGPSVFHGMFRHGPTRLLLHGEGGAGKTTLALQIARWGMTGGEQGMCVHAMLPVLIEHDLDPGDDSFFRAVRGRLQDLIGQEDPVSESLTEQLLRQRRVLVIVDGLSERSGATRTMIQPADPRFAAAALVITSRRPESLAGAIVTRIEPVRVRGDRLSSFMESYLQQLGSRALFSDVEYFDACRKLSALVQQRETTVLLAKLYAELMVAAKDPASAGRSELPSNVPELMFAYLNRLNRDRRPDDPDHHDVHRTASVVAWESVRRSYQPTAARRDDVLRLLGDDGALRLRYLESNLGILQTTGPMEDEIRLTLDPLAEYLAADWVVRKCNGDPKQWQCWLEEFAGRVAEVGIENVAGFGHALLDCLGARGRAHAVPPGTAAVIEGVLRGGAPVPHVSVRPPG